MTKILVIALIIILILSFSAIIITDSNFAKLILRMVVVPILVITTIPIIRTAYDGIKNASEWQDTLYYIGKCVFSLLFIGFDGYLTFSATRRKEQEVKRKSSKEIKN